MGTENIMWTVLNKFWHYLGLVVASGVNRGAQAVALSQKSHDCSSGISLISGGKHFWNLKDLLSCGFQPLQGFSGERRLSHNHVYQKPFLRLASILLSNLIKIEFWAHIFSSKSIFLGDIFQTTPKKDLSKIDIGGGLTNLVLGYDVEEVIKSQNDLAYAAIAENSV